MLVGKTGSGKSTRMVRELAWRVQQTRKIDPAAYKMILIDTKPISFGQDDDEGHYAFTGGRIYRDWKLIDLRKETSRIVIYRPMPNLVNPDEFGKFFNSLQQYQVKQGNGKSAPLPMTIIIDELIDVFSSERKRTTYIEGFTKILTEGRSALQTLWILTQFPVYIDAAIKRNVSVNFVFRLPDENDRKTMAGILGNKLVSDPIRNTHGFWFQNDAIEATMEQPLYFTGTDDRTLSLIRGGRTAIA